MTDLVTPGEPVIRLGIFLGAFVLFAVWEWITPRRARSFAYHTVGDFRDDCVER